ncbi:SDR family oxidoreductase [Burkholderia pseudomultivorans]|uniref:SDR family oxidoreductase n=1 Tax=Burkholderia pseudomultivorans TaxID=1207504 RepID=UPI000770C04D|nr:SDR family oxidoreductase [Burkholderia pseudomultivorans]KWF06436.1 3-oxoacyl-ACP reductase [Burkholderia pseudomultivorans]
MDLGIVGKVALVLGGAGGLGAAIATALAREGAAVVIADRDDNGLRAVQERLRGQNLNCHTELWDLANLGVVDAKVRSIESRVGNVQILVNNTGGPPPSVAYGLGPDVWREHFEKMVQAPIAITDRVLPTMRKNRWGRVITSASSGVIAPIPNLAVSNSLRSALVGWSKSLAREVAADGVTANIVVPGRIATDRIKFLDEQRAKREGTTVEAVSAQSTSSIPVGRYGRPEEYADMIAFLASERASYVTGSILRVDGGLIASV